MQGFPHRHLPDVLKHCFTPAEEKRFGVFQHGNQSTVLNCLRNPQGVFSTAGWGLGEMDTFKRVAPEVLTPSQCRTPVKQVSNSRRA